MSTRPEESARGDRGPAAGPRNRRALRAAAREVLREQGLSAPFSAIARRAGVGQGSLYRHFPDRIALAVAVFDEDVAELERLAEAEGSTLADLIDVVIGQAVAADALIDLTSSRRSAPAAVRLGERLRAVVRALVSRDHAAGLLGAHVDADDVLLAVGMLAAELARTPADERATTASRARALVDRAFAP